MSLMSFCWLPQRGVLSVSGMERRSFLQALVSNDVNKVSATSSIYAALLTPQGKFLHEFFITEIEECLLLETESARLDALRTQLTRFQLRAQVSLTIPLELAVAVAFGSGITAALNLGNTRNMCRLMGRGIAYIDPRLPEGGIRFIGTKDTLVNTFKEIGCCEVGCATYEKVRLTYGLPDGSRDIAIGRAGLLEYGFEELNGIDFHKGCYVGQEVVSRSKYRSLLKRRSVPVLIDGPVPTLGTRLFLEQQEAGEMLSSVDDIGLSLVKIEFLRKAQHTCQPFRAGTTRLIPRLPAWLVLPNVPSGRQSI